MNEKECWPTFLGILCLPSLENRTAAHEDAQLLDQADTLPLADTYLLMRLAFSATKPLISPLSLSLSLNQE